MTVEQEQQGFVIAPEFKVSKFDGSTAEFAGRARRAAGRGGLLVGGGVYTLTNGSRVAG